MMIRQCFSATQNATTVTAAFQMNVKASSALLVITWSGDATEGITGITDTLGNTYTEVADSAVSTYRFECWRAANAGGAGANTVSVTFSANALNTKQVWIVEVVDMASLSNGPSNTLNQSATSPTPLATLTVAQTGVVLTAAVTPSGSWTVSGILDTTGGNGWAWLNSGGSVAMRQAFARVIDPSVDASVGPAITGSSRAAESMTVAVYGTSSGGGGGGGETAHVFIG